MGGRDDLIEAGYGATAKSPALLAREADPRVVVATDVIRYSDADSNGHVNNAVYAVLSESGRVQYLRRRVTPLVGAQVYYVVARLVIEFKAESFYPAQAHTASWIEKLGRTSATFRQEIYVAGALCATAECVCVLMDPQTRRPTPIPDDARAILAQAVIPAAETGA